MFTHTQSEANREREHSTSKSRSGEDNHQSAVTSTSILDLLDQEATHAFAGLTPADDAVYPDAVSPETRCLDPDPQSLKDVLSVLPQASSGGLWATNEFVGVDGTIDIEALRNVDGLDIDTLETATGQSLSEIATNASSDPLVRVRDHQDIVDERRKALCALGFDVKFRWQIASDRYSIINPQEAYFPIVGALQQRGETEAFGWASYRDWGGLLKMFVVCPGLEHTVTAREDPEIEEDADGITTVSGPNESDLVVYGGFETGYDFRGTQMLWAKPILYFPETGTIVPDTGKRYTRRHYGRATDADHERANDRVPINEWWKAIYDDIADRLVKVDLAIRRTRAIAYDFGELPFDAAGCYRYWGVANRYAEAAADRATTLASPSSRPTVYNLQLSLLIALLDEYEGSWASNTHQEYLEIAGELLRKPAMMIQLAMKEHDRKTDEPEERVLPATQQTLSDALEDVVDIPGIEVDTEANLTDGAAQRLHDRVQHRLDDIEGSS
ncbi:hypothetical protein [Haloarcula onubensis]|uniref:Uncharacterized protein n=1 Tax=Haloarcula onubensis TaxID=2950539 RepID=A0ABU2FT59_9EURY|nr:hypothetical protein [Halomicroarcula sp. S3CR25-11]MDS0283930.1 hypothetical protein [Halomicroarcula sp. S3CR25-11]